MPAVDVHQLVQLYRFVKIDVPTVPSQTEEQRAALALAYVKAAIAAGQPLPWKFSESPPTPVSGPAVDDIPF